MRLFGLDISKAPSTESRIPLKGNRYLPAAIWKWMFNRQWAKNADIASLLNAYRSWVYVAASRNSSTFAETPLKLYAAKPTSGTKIIAPHRNIISKKQDYLFKTFGDLQCVRKGVELVEITEHPFINLLSSVNPFMNKTDLLEISDLYQELTGDCYWYLVPGALGIPQEIWPLPPDRVRIVPDPVKFISHYKYTLGIQEIDFGTEEIIHFKWPNPSDQYYGASPLQAVSDMYNINQNMNMYENALLSNNARPEGFFTTKNEIDDVTFERLKAEINDTWTGVTNAGKTGFLDSDIHYEKTSLSPRELGFIQGRKWTKEEIFEAFGIPIGLYDANANRANAEAAQYTYSKYAISPRHKRFSEKLNEQLMPLYDERLFVAFDNVVPEDKEFELKEDTELFKIGARSINEIRQGRGNESIDDGDMHFIQNSLVPLEMAGQSLAPPERPDKEAVEEMIETITNNIISGIAR